MQYGRDQKGDSAWLQVPEANFYLSQFSVQPALGSGKSYLLLILIVVFVLPNATFY